MAKLRRFFLFSCIIIVLLFSVSCQDSATSDQDEAYKIEAREKAMSAAIGIVESHHYDHLITPGNLTEFADDYRTMLTAVYNEILPFYLSIYGVTAR